MTLHDQPPKQPTKNNFFLGREKLRMTENQNERPATKNKIFQAVRNGARHVIEPMRDLHTAEKFSSR